MNIEKLIKENDGLNIKKFSLDCVSVVYFICETDGEIIYVGKTNAIGGRIVHHRKQFPEKSIYYIECSKGTINEIESKFIKKTKAKHNIHLAGRKPIHRPVSYSRRLYQACIIIEKILWKVGTRGGNTSLKVGMRLRDCWTLF